MGGDDGAWLGWILDSRAGGGREEGVWNWGWRARMSLGMCGGWFGFGGVVGAAEFVCTALSRPGSGVCWAGLQAGLG